MSAPGGNGITIHEHPTPGKTVEKKIECPKFSDHGTVSAEDECQVGGITDPAIKVLEQRVQAALPTKVTEAVKAALAKMPHCSDSGACSAEQTDISYTAATTTTSFFTKPMETIFSWAGLTPKRGIPMAKVVATCDWYIDRTCS